MKTISINTTQNVVIEYELGSLRDRIFAFIIDFFLLVVGATTIYTLLASLLPHGAMDVVGFFILLIASFNTLLFEYFMNGQTVGKKAMRLKVVKISGEEAGLTDYITRWTFRLVDIYFSLGSIAGMLISSSQKSQRVGDMAANTAVVYVRPSRDVSVKQILNALNNQNYTVTFPEARIFTDSEMLVLKQVIDRCEKYNNRAHEDALIEAAEIVKQRMGVTENFYNYRKFLKTVLTDYVVLTR